MTEEPPTDSVVRHWLPHPAERVHAAFLDPEVLVRWYGPDGLQPEPGSVHVEPVVGGSWRLVLAAEHDQHVRVAVERTLTRLEPGRLLEAEEPGPDDTPVRWRVETREDPSGTTLEVREGPLPPAAVALGAAGWSQALARLEQVLGAPR